MPIRCPECGKQLIKLGSHMATHKNKPSAQNSGSALQGMMKKVSVFAIPLIVSFLLIPWASQILLSLGYSHFPISNAPLEHISPRINSYYPQNLQIFSFNDSIIFFADLSDEGGSGIDFDNSTIAVQKDIGETGVIQTFSVPTNNTAHRINNLSPGTYTMRITARDKSGNEVSQISNFYVKDKPSVKLSIFPGAPIERANQTYAIFEIENVGDETLIDFAAGFTDPDNQNYSWAEQNTNLLMPGAKTEILLPVKLNLACNYSAEPDTRLFVEQNGTQYLLAKNNTKKVCTGGEINLKLFSLQNKYQYEKAFRYPYYDGYLNMTFETNTAILVYNESEIPASASEIGVSIVDPVSFCHTRPELDFDFCYDWANRN